MNKTSIRKQPLQKLPSKFALLCTVGAGLLMPPAALAVTLPVPREKIHLSCVDDYFKTSRTDFLLDDEHYSSCTLSLPLALTQRWKGSRRFYILPRLAADVTGQDRQKNEKRVRMSLANLINPGKDPLHRVIPSEGYKAIELVSQIRRPLREWVGEDFQALSYNISGKVTVCVGPVYTGEDPCVTFDVIARFKVYRK